MNLHHLITLGLRWRKGTGGTTVLSMRRTVKAVPSRMKTDHQPLQRAQIRRNQVLKFRRLRIRLW